MNTESIPEVLEKEKARFYSYIKRNENGCWDWIGSKSIRGYGKLFLREGNRSYPAHRISYKIFRGDVPSGSLVCHVCDRTSCVRPDHLFLGTQFENMRDASKKGKLGMRIRGEKHWNVKYTDDQVKEIRNRWNSGEDCGTIGKSLGMKTNSVWQIAVGKSRKNLEIE